MEALEGVKIPTIVPVSKNFTPGKGIKIHCVVPLSASRFNISLHCGTDVTRQDDIALQISFNLLNNNTTVNSRQNGTWDEERCIPGIPFKCGDKFQLVLLCDCSHYKVFINGQPYCEFPQNIAYDCITYLAINGDVIVVQISYEAEALLSTSYGFTRSDIPLSVYDIEAQPKNDATIPLNSSNLRPVPRSKLKQYIIFSSIVLVIIIIILCAVFIPMAKKSDQPYDFD